MKIEIGKIKVTERIRKNIGGIEELAANIREHGLISPIAVMTLDGGEFRLLAGLRRLRAMEINGETEIEANVFPASDAEEALNIEHSENVQREGFTFSELADYTKMLAVIEKAKGKERMSAGGKGKKEGVDCSPHLKQGRSRDAIGEKINMSGRQYDRMKFVAKHATPEVIEQLDRGERTIRGVYEEMKARDKPAPPPKAKVPLKDKPAAPQTEAFTVKTPSETETEAETETETETDVDLNASSDGNITETDTQADTPDDADGADAAKCKAAEPQKPKPRKSKKLTDEEIDDLVMSRLSPKDREAVLRNKAFNAMTPEEKVVELQSRLKAERTRATVAETELSMIKIELHNAVLHRDGIISSLQCQLEAARARIRELTGQPEEEAPNIDVLDIEALDMDALNEEAPDVETQNEEAEHGTD